MIGLRMAAVLAVLAALPGSEALGQQATPGGDAGKQTPPSITLKVKREQSTKKTSGAAEIGARTADAPGGGAGRRPRMRVADNADSTARLWIEIRSLSSKTIRVSLEWYFVAKDVDGGKQWIFDHGSKALDLMANGPAMIENVESQSLESTVITLRRGARAEFGGEIAGYIVLVKSDGKILKTAASPRSLEDVAGSPEAIQKLMVKSAGR